ncbi:MAG: nucleotide sugar dehydrogenase [Bacteriovoracaceae bacterium]
MKLDHQESKYAIVRPQDSIKKTIQTIDLISRTGGVSGVAAVLDENSRICGVVTDGDIRSLICQDYDMNEAVEAVMSKNFTYVLDSLSRKEQLEMVLKQKGNFKNPDDPRLSKVIVCDQEKKFHGIINLVQLYQSKEFTAQKIAVYGLGYVGLTLALTLAEEELFNVSGVDINQNLITNLNKGKPPFFEKGLDPLLDYCLTEKRIQFLNPDQLAEADVHIISVGTPVDEQGKVIFDYLQSAGAMIGSRLQRGNLVICRSTVPVGTTRKTLIPILEKESGLVAGKDFHIAFAPERTVEGNALRELRTLPQVVGGLTKRCASICEEIFKKINGTIVRVDSIEEAEIVKLINNTFRDTVFAFANQVALLCEDYNVNAFNVIQAANEGYPRNPIPKPSPGVGGICLVKDPFLFSYSFLQKPVENPFGKTTRSINAYMPTAVFNKFEKFFNTTDKKNKRVFIIGLAFKGLPETSDIRYSPSVALIEQLIKHGFDVTVYDNVINENEIKMLGFKYSSIEDGVKKSIGTFIMNNHPKNSDFDYYKLIKNSEEKKFFFDGWNLFNASDIKTLSNVVYGTLGFISQEDHRE